MSAQLVDISAIEESAGQYTATLGYVVTSTEPTLNPLLDSDLPLENTAYPFDAQAALFCDSRRVVAKLDSESKVWKVELRFSNNGRFKAPAFRSKDKLGIQIDSDTFTQAKLQYPYFVYKTNALKLPGATAGSFVYRNAWVRQTGEIYIANEVRQLVVTIEAYTPALRAAIIAQLNKWHYFAPGTGQPSFQFVSADVQVRTDYLTEVRYSWIRDPGNGSLSDRNPFGGAIPPKQIPLNAVIAPDFARPSWTKYVVDESSVGYNADGTAKTPLIYWDWIMNSTDVTGYSGYLTLPGITS